MASQVNRYRYYCQTESNYVYKWDTSKPTACVNNVAHTVDSDSVTMTGNQYIRFGLYDDRN